MTQGTDNSVVEELVVVAVGSNGGVVNKDTVSLLANVAFDFRNFRDPRRLWASFRIGYRVER